MGDIVGSDFEAAGIVFVATVASRLSRYGGEESGDEGERGGGPHGDDDDDVLLRGVKFEEYGGFCGFFGELRFEKIRVCKQGKGSE